MTTITPRPSSEIQWKEIITHWWPHFDEILAIKLLKRHGRKVFPGIEKAKIAFLKTGNPPEGKTWEELWNEGRLCVGVVGGPFDEHPSITGEARKGRESASSLVEKYLGVHNHPLWRQLIKFVTEADQEGVHPMHVANRLKAKYRLNPDKPEIGMQFALDMISDWEKEQEFFLQAQDQLNQSGDKSQFRVGGTSGPLVNLAVVESDNFKMGSATRADGAHILVQKSTRGHVHVFTNNQAGIRFDMSEVMDKIRILEMGAGDGAPPEPSREHFCRQGKIPEVGNWYYQVPGENLLNGSETTPDTEPTRARLEDIVQTVRDFTHVRSPGAPAPART